MKANKIWFVILFILVAGIGLTSNTRKIVSTVRETVSQESVPEDWEKTEAIAKRSLDEEVSAAAAMEVPDTFSSQIPVQKSIATEADASEEAETIASGTDRNSGIAVAAFPVPDASLLEESDSSQMMAETQELDASEIGIAEAEQEAAAKIGDETLQSSYEASSRQRKAGSYVKRLEELDVQIARKRTVSSDTTANTLKASAESEKKLWETELKRILDILEKNFDAEEADALFLEQKEWIRNREDTAVEDSKKQSGSAMEEVEYNLSIAKITRERVYELANEYADILDEEN